MLLNTNYLKGQYAEYAVRRKLQALGFNWIIRSYASRTPIDLLASNGTEMLAIQVKSGKASYLSDVEIQALVEWSSRFNARPILALKRKGKWLFKDVILTSSYQPDRATLATPSTLWNTSSD